MMPHEMGFRRIWFLKMVRNIYPDPLTPNWNGRRISPSSYPKTDRMQMKAIRFFTDSAGVLLLGMAMAMFIANWASAGLVPPRDPVFMVSMRTIFWIVGALELGVALICLLGER